VEEVKRSWGAQQRAGPLIDFHEKEKERDINTFWIDRKMRLNCQSAFDVLIARKTKLGDEQQQRLSRSNDSGLPKKS
jgi:hypothetical protein